MNDIKINEKVYIMRRGNLCEGRIMNIKGCKESDSEEFLRIEYQIEFDADSLTLQRKDFVSYEEAKELIDRVKKDI